MLGASTPNRDAELRGNPRALLGATALVIAPGKPATQHLTHDLSVGGVRLCGLPLACPGDEVKVLLRLENAWVRARGHLLRRGSTDRRPDFAIQFSRLSASAEDAIQDAVVTALAEPQRPSVLLIQDGQPNSWPGRYWPGWRWLDPISRICSVARTPLSATRRLEEFPIEVAILSEPAKVQAREWAEAHPGVDWRTLEKTGRLQSVATTFGLRF